MGEGVIVRHRIAGLLDRLEIVFAEMAKTVDAAEMDQRRQLIALRRDLSDRLADLNRAIDAGTAQGWIDTDLDREYRDRFATYRRAVSMHQTEWPTILISDDIQAYLAAGRALRAKRDVFMTWMRTIFLPLVKD